MKIVVSKQGGMFPVDQLIEVVEDRVSVSDGDSNAPRSWRLRSDDTFNLGRLARRVISSGDQVESGSVGVDGGVTKIELEDGAARAKVEIRSGESTSDDVWQLLDVVEDVTAFRR